LLGWSAVCQMVDAQFPDVIGGPAIVHPDLERLPPVDQQLPPPKGLPLDVPAEADTQRQAAEVLADEIAVEEEPQQQSKPWEGSFKLGLDGTEGNSQTFNFRFGFDAKHTTEHNVLALDLDYRKATNRFIETANQAFFDWRYERLFQDSAWTSFVHGIVDYDEFQAFDARTTVDIGLGYKIVKTEFTELAARAGSGCSREIGGPDDAYVPEAVFGLDFERRLNQRHKLTASAEYTPDMTGMKNFRLRSRASWEALIDRKMNLSLKLSVLERHDSTPHDAAPNDLDYSAVLLWKF